MKKIIKLQKRLHNESNLLFPPAPLRPVCTGWEAFFNSDSRVSDDFMANRVQPVNQKIELF